MNGKSVARPAPASMRGVDRRKLYERLENVGVVALLIALVVYFATSNSQFVTEANLLALLSGIAVLGVVSLGQTGVIVGGGFDLSVGGAVALGAILFVSFSNGGTPTLAAMVLAVAVVGFGIGAVNGLAVVKVGINPLIATLGTLSIAGGIANSIANGLTVPLDNPAAAVLGETAIGAIPNYLWLAGALFAVAAFVLRRTTIGRAVYVLGGNTEAARLAGHRVDAITIALYVTSAGLAALAGCITAAQLLAASPNAGATTTLLSITAVVLGGGSLAGGRGGALGTLLGVLVLGTLSNGLAINAVPTFYRDIVTGAVLLLAVGVSALRARRV